MRSSRTSSVGSYEAKTRFSELLELVESGKEITITRHGSPVAKLIPVKRGSSSAQRQAAIEQWMEVSRSLTLNGLKLRDLIEEGRP